MIRDPSDGSVRETKSVLPRSSDDGSILSHPMPVSEPGMASGLPTASSKPENIARLEKSRDWLKDWKAKRGAA